MKQWFEYPMFLIVKPNPAGTWVAGMQFHRINIIGFGICNPSPIDKTIE